MCQDGTPARLSRAPAALFRRLSVDVVVLVPTATVPAVLSGAAADLWDLLVDPIGFDDAVNELAHFYAMAPGEISAALAPVVESLLDDGVLCRTT